MCSSCLVVSACSGIQQRSALPNRCRDRLHKQARQPSLTTACLVEALHRIKPIARAALCVLSFFLRQFRSPALFFLCHDQAGECQLAKLYVGLETVMQGASVTAPFAFVNIACAHALHVLLSSPRARNTLPAILAARIHSLHAAVAQATVTRQMLCKRLDGTNIPCEGELLPGVHRGSRFCPLMFAGLLLDWSSYLPVYQATVVSLYARVHKLVAGSDETVTAGAPLWPYLDPTAADPPELSQPEQKVAPSTEPAHTQPNDSAEVPPSACGTSPSTGSTPLDAMDFAAAHGGFCCALPVLPFSYSEWARSYHDRQVC